MATAGDLKPVTSCHVVVVPFPGRGHINPVMNFCKQLVSKCPHMLITFVVTEEWLGFLSSEPKPPENIQFGTIPNVIPSELVRAGNHSAFVEAVETKMEAPVERLLDRIDPPAIIVYDVFIKWVTGLANRRNVPVAPIWPMSATTFFMFSRSHLLHQNGHLPVTNLSEQGENMVAYIPGISPTRILDLPTPFYGSGKEILHICLEAISMVQKAQYLLFPSIYELEQQVIDAIRAEYSMPVYAIGPAIPYFNIEKSSVRTQVHDPDYFKWLDNQPNCSVLYISQGSFLSVSNEQLDEIIAGVNESGVRYFWVTRMEASRIIGGGCEKGLVVPWCDQLRVLCHPSIGGFWSHCGWNSTKEGVVAGIPMLTLPIMWDQILNSKVIVEDWKTGWRVKRRLAVETLVTRDEIASLLQRCMDLESDEGKAIRERAKELKEIARQASAEGGSSEHDIDAFIRDITRS